MARVVEARGVLGKAPRQEPADGADPAGSPREAGEPSVLILQVGHPLDPVALLLPGKNVGGLGLLVHAAVYARAMPGRETIRIRPMKGSYGKALRIARAAKGMSQQDLAKHSGVRPSYVSMIERGERDNPSQEVKKALAKALRVSEVTLTALSCSRQDVCEMDEEERNLVANIILSAVTG